MKLITIVTVINSIKIFLLLTSLLYSRISFAQSPEIIDDTSARQRAMQRLEPMPQQPNNEFILNDGQFHSSAVIGYNNATQYKFSNMRVLGGGIFPVTGSYSAEVSPAFSIGYRGIYLPSNGMGFTGGLSYEQNREISSESFSYSNTTTNANYSTKPSFQIILLEANLAYRWRKIYMNFGINYSKPTFVSAGSSGADVSVNSGVGGQIGAGILFNKYYFVDLQAKTITVQSTYHQGSTTFVLGDGYLTGLEMHIGYIF